MTDDPIKLFVVVMSILLCVLGFVAYASWDQADAYETAVANAKRQSELLKDHAGEVLRLCNQVGQSMRQGERTLIYNAAQYNHVKISRFKTEKDKKLGMTGREKRFRVEVSRGRGAVALTRDQIAKFCRTVERTSRGILKTIEITMRRAGKEKAGTLEEVVNETYTVTIIFGLRVIS